MVETSNLLMIAKSLGHTAAVVVVIVVKIDDCSVFGGSVDAAVTVAVVIAARVVVCAVTGV